MPIAAFFERLMRSSVMTGLVSGKVAIVTGGAAGIGEAISKLFARHGAAVVVNGLPGDPVDEVVKEIRSAGGVAEPCVADIATETGARLCVNAAVRAFGRLDVLIANAGIFPEQKEIHEFPVERFDELLHHNVKSVYMPVRAALPELRKTKGVVLAATSEAATIAVPQAVSYGATKGWITSFIKGVAAEQAKYGVRANAVAPGPIDTEMTRPTKGEMNLKTSLLAVGHVPLGRRGTPEEVANMYLFLASDLASYCTGGVYNVDGGSTATTGVPALEAKRDVKQQPESTLDLEHQYEGRQALAGSTPKTKV
jgi:NAD(P)-dependent dehydrogenase (short-subunit alcohol dehydrogenase family)